MKKVIKTIFCSAFCFLSIGQGAAQEQAAHEISVTGGFGLSSLKFSLDNGDHKQKVGGLLGVNYSYFFNESFSINSGLEVTLYSSEATMNSFTDKYTATDTEESFVFNTAVSDYKEKQRSAYLNIPIMGQYQLPVLDEHKFYAAAGVKIGLPLNGSYKTSDANFETSGTYYNQTTITDSPGLGFYKFKGKEVDKDIDFKTAWILSLETGMKWKVSPSMSLYTGIYFDYGMNDIRKGDKNQKFLTYESPDKGKKAEDFHLNSMLQSQYSTDGTSNKSMTDKVVPMALGLKLRLAFSLPQ